MNRKKVLHILYELKFSGAEIMYVDAAPIFQEKGFDLTVLGTAPQLGEFAPYFQNAGYEVLHLPCPDLKNIVGRIKFYLALIKLIKNEKIDIVHTHSSRLMWGGAFCSWIAGVKSIYTFHNVFETKKITYPYYLFLRWSAKNIFKCNFQTISDSVHNNEKKRFHNATTKIYNWYGSNRFFPAIDGEKELIRKELNIDSQTLVLISVGGCSHVKRHSEIIEALPLILKKIPNILYLHLGKGESEKDEEILSQKLGLDKHIRFCGNEANVRKYLIASDIYLMPSKFEGIPITTIEAMGCKIPAILYDVPGLRDFNKDGENSILIPADYKILAEKVVYLHQHKEISNQIAERAKIFVDTHFNMAQNCAKIINLYNNNATIF
ncbi:MAG: glycosyltransferase [Bacteroidales bacterium]|nr:glycosyltransferase [Bacteroidales bacterium]